MTLAQNYAKALFDSVKGKDVALANRLVESLVALLERRGHRSLLPAIVREYRRLSERHSTRQTRVILAREKDGKAFQDEIEKEFSRLRLHSEDFGAVKREYDETLVGGYRIDSGGQVIDASYKTQLLTLYQKIVSE